MIVSDEELMRKTIRAFRDAGYEIWMDDFGSGYSSLTMLKENGIKDEDINWSNYYQKASLNARATDIPLEIVEDDGKTFKTLFMNRACLSFVFFLYSCIVL